MKIICKDFEQEISQLVLHKSKFQKVVICYDNSADKQLLDRLNERLSKQVVLINFYLNDNEDDFFKVVQNGARVVIYNVGINNYLKIKDNNNFLIKIFVPTSAFALPYLTAGDSVYCDNLFVDKRQMDYLTIIALYDAGVAKLWADLQQGNRVDLEVFKNLDYIVNNKNKDVFPIAQYLSNYIDEGWSEDELPYYIYLKLCYIYKMLEKFKFNEERPIDFYKLNLTQEELNKAYSVIVKSEVVDYLRLYCDNLMRVISALIMRVKILIKKYIKNTKINIKKLDEKLKSNSKHLKIDNLLYISHIFGGI